MAPNKALQASPRHSLRSRGPLACEASLGAPERERYVALATSAV